MLSFNPQTEWTRKQSFALDFDNDMCHADFLIGGETL
jgi:hypothetical protein